MTLIFKTISFYFFLAVLIFAELLLLKGGKANDFLLPVLVADLIIFLALAIYNTNLCLNLVIMILPFKAVLFVYEIGIVSFDLYTGCIILLSAVCLFKIFLGQDQLNYRFVLSDIILIIFAVVCLSFFITSSDIIKSGLTYFHSVAIPALTYFTIRILLTDVEKYSLFKLHLLFAVTIMAVLGCIEFCQFGQRIGTISGSAQRSSIFFILAIFLVISFRKKKYLFIGTVNLLALIFGFSRNYLFSLVISPLYYFFCKKGLNRILFLLLAVSTLLFTIWFAGIATSEQYNRFRREFKREHHYAPQSDVATTGQRLTSVSLWRLNLYGLGIGWREDLKSFISHPILGVGMGNTKTQIASSHNLHIQLLSYTGVIGYIIFNMFIFSAIKLRRIEQINNVILRDLLFLSTSVFIIYINGITNGLFHGSFNYVLFMVLALIQNLKAIAFSDKTEPL